LGLPAPVLVRRRPRNQFRAGDTIFIESSERFGLTGRIAREIISALVGPPVSTRVKDLPTMQSFGQFILELGTEC
jgi:hypothetical protein